MLFLSGKWQDVAVNAIKIPLNYQGIFANTVFEINNNLQRQILKSPTIGAAARVPGADFYFGFRSNIGKNKQLLHKYFYNCKP